MPRERTYRTEAIVIRRSDFGEADRLLTLFSGHYAGYWGSAPDSFGPFALIIAGAILAAVRGWWLPAGLCTGLAALTRADGLLIVLVLGAAVARLLYYPAQRVWPAIAVPALLVALVVTYARNAWIGALAATGTSIDHESAIVPTGADDTVVVFPLLHGPMGEDGTVQGALELLGIPYTGSGVMASAISMDKVMTKRIWRAEGLPTPDWRLVASGEETAMALQALGAPMIVKPAREGSTIGLTKVSSPEQCEQAYALASKYDPEVLCEQFIEGDETTCPILGEGASAHALPVIRIVAPQGNYDYEHKYFTDDTQYHCPSGLPEAEEREIQRLVVQAFRSLGCRGWARADIMIRASDRKPFLLEINTSPGMTGHSLVPMSARALGISYEDLCVGVLATATLNTPPGATLSPAQSQPQEATTP